MVFHNIGSIRVFSSYLTDIYCRSDKELVAYGIFQCKLLWNSVLGPLHAATNVAARIADAMCFTFMDFVFLSYLFIQLADTLSFNFVCFSVRRVLPAFFRYIVW